MTFQRLTISGKSMANTAQLKSKGDDAAGAISLTANRGSSETITVTNTQGTDDAAIALTATAGGVDIDANKLYQEINDDDKSTDEGKCRFLYYLLWYFNII